VQLRGQPPGRVGEDQSIPRERAAAMASNTTAPGSPPTGRRPRRHFSRPSGELLARRGAKVSPREQHRAALIWKYLASLPIEVVFPEPLTPASITMHGFLPDKSSVCSERREQLEQNGP